MHKLSQVSECENKNSSIHFIEKQTDSLKKEKASESSQEACPRVPNVDGLRKLILEEAHSSQYSNHRGSMKMYRDLRDIYWWNGIVTPQNRA